MRNHRKGFVAPGQKEIIFFAGFTDENHHLIEEWNKKKLTATLLIEKVPADKKSKKVL